MDLGLVGADVIYYTTEFGESPIPPRAAKVVAVVGHKRVNLAVEQTGEGKDWQKPQKWIARNVLLSEPGVHCPQDENKKASQFWCVLRSKMPGHGDWYSPRAIQTAPPVAKNKGEKDKVPA